MGNAGVASHSMIGSQRGLLLAYQPIVASGDRRRAAWYEALLRERAPDGSVHSLAGRFTAPDGAGFECAMDRETPALLHRDLLGLPAMRAALNVSPSSLGDPAWQSAMTPMLSDPRCHGRIMLEITERTEVDLSALRHLKRLGDAGIFIALDDMTPDRLSNALASHIAPHVIKLDRSMVFDLSNRDPHVLDLIKDAQNTCGAVIVAEGIENSQAYFSVARAGIPYQQGYFHGKPMPKVGSR